MTTSAVTHAGAVNIMGGAVALTNNIFHSNVATLYGGAIFYSQGCIATHTIPGWQCTSNFDWQPIIGCFCNLMLIMHRVMHCCDIHYTLHFQAFLPALMAPIACNVHWQHALLCHQAWSAHTASGCEPVPMAVAELQAQLHFASIKSNTFKQQQDAALQAFKARSASARVRRLHS